MKPANRIEVKRDGRVLLFGTYYQQMKAKLRQLANGYCEKCGTYVGANGDVHHRNGRGGGKRDDRIIIGDAAGGARNLYYFCRSCHSGHHVPEKVVPAKPTESEFDRLIGIDRYQCRTVITKQLRTDEDT